MVAQIGPSLADVEALLDRRAENRLAQLDGSYILASAIVDGQMRHQLMKLSVKPAFHFIPNNVKLAQDVGRGERDPNPYS